MYGSAQHKATGKKISKTAKGLSWLQSMYYFLLIDDAQDGDSEHIIDTGNGNNNDVVNELCTAFAVFC